MSTADNSSSEKHIEATDKNASPEKPHRSRRPHKKEHHVIGPLVGLILLGGVAGVVWLNKSINQKNVQQQDAINVLRGQLQTAQQQSATLINQLQEKLAQQQQSQDELRDNLSTLLKRNDHLRKDWLLGEAEYLIKLASYRLQLQRDVSTALRAMQAADERLRDVGDPALLPVRKVLAEDQNTLRNIPSADITGMSLSLSALIGNIDKLPLNTPTPQNVQDNQSSDTGDKNITDWKELPAVIWQDIKGLVTIRQHDDKIATLLSPKENFYLLQNLRLQLEQARLALLLGKGDVFAERIKAANAWLIQFFDLKDASVQNTQQTLTQLSTVNIEPEIPGIDKSYQALKAYLAGVPIKTSKINNKPATEKKAAAKQPKPVTTKPAAKVVDKTTDKPETAPPLEDKAADKPEAAPTTDSKVQL